MRRVWFTTCEYETDPEFPASVDTYNDMVNVPPVDEDHVGEEEDVEENDPPDALQSYANPLTSSELTPLAVRETLRPGAFTGFGDPEMFDTTGSIGDPEYAPVSVGLLPLEMVKAMLAGEV